MAKNELFVVVVLAMCHICYGQAGCADALGAGRGISTVYGGTGTSLVAPTAIAFNPVDGSLYVTDHSTSSIVAINYSSPTRSARYLRDRARYHYMDKVSGISFDPVGQYATCQESLNTYKGQMLPNFFMGPTLYDSRIDLVNSKQEPCLDGETCYLIHIDMLHEAPYCMGIAHDNAPSWVAAGRTYRNVYWTYDGGSSQLVRFDFESDHGPGSMDHSLAEVRRYTGLLLSRVADVPSQVPLHTAPPQLTPPVPPLHPLPHPTPFNPTIADGSRLGFAPDVCERHRWREGDCGGCRLRKLFIQRKAALSDLLLPC